MSTLVSMAPIYLPFPPSLSLFPFPLFFPSSLSSLLPHLLPLGQQEAVNALRSRCNGSGGLHHPN